MAIPILIAGAIVGVMVLIGIMYAVLYKKATSEMAFVRTGSGGALAVKDGGAMVIPFLHEVMPVSLETRRIEISRTAREALISLDKIRVDIVVEAAIRVRAEDKAIKTAAQTLGRKTLDAHHLKEMVEGKIVDALRSVAATMTIDDLHKNRADFIQNVQNAVKQDLDQIGLELESASLIGLDQTSTEHMDENNSFDAIGLSKINEVVQQQKKERNDVEQQTRIDIETRTLEANQQALQIDQRNEEAKINKARDVARMQAEAEAEEARARAQSKAAQAQADAEAREKSEQARIASDQALKLAEQAREIAENQKSEEVSKAQASAERARAEEVTAEEELKTAQETAQAERAKQIATIAAQQEAEVEATRKRIAATAEKEAAADHAEALRTEADAAAYDTKTRAEAEQAAMQAQAEGKRALNDAENTLSEAIIRLRITEKTLEVLPAVMAEAVKPAEAIDSITVMDAKGLIGGGAANANGEDGVAPSMPQQVVDAIQRNRLQGPLIDRLLNATGMDINDLSKLVPELTQQTGTAMPAAPAAEDAVNDASDAPNGAGRAAPDASDQGAADKVAANKVAADSADV
jgi:uncharacterized membrane protein YqiK